MKLRVPHTFALLFGLVVVAAIATHWIPAGQYERQEVDGRELVLPDSYHRVEGEPAGLAEVFLAYPRGLVETAYIVFYIFIIGGAFGVINATGAVEASIQGIVRACKGRGELIVAVLVVLVLACRCDDRHGRGDPGIPAWPADSHQAPGV